MSDVQNLKKLLAKMVQQKRAAGQKEKQIRAGQNSEDRNAILKAVLADLKIPLTESIKELSQNSRLSVEELKQAIAESLKMPEMTMPEVKVPEIKLPQINVPPVKMPQITIPPIEMPDEMTVKGWINLMGYDRGMLSNPLPVQLRDAEGKPVSLGGLTQMVGSSGKSDYFTIKGYAQSAFTELLNPDGRVKVELPSGSSGLTDTELRASSVPVEQVSGSIWSTYVTGSFSSTAANDLVNGDNRLRVSVETGGSGLTDAELRASSVPVAQLSGASWSVEATITGTPTIQATNLDIRDLDYTTDDVSVYQVSGSNWSVSVTDFAGSVGATLLNGDGLYRDTLPIQGTVAVSGVTNTVGVTMLDGDGLMKATFLVSDVTASVKAALIDSSGVQYSGSNPVPITGTVAVSGVTNSVATANIDSSGVQYSGSNPFPMRFVTGAYGTAAVNLVDSSGVAYGTPNPMSVNVNGALNSVIAIGDALHDAVDDGGAPQKVGGIAMTANPAAVSGGDRVAFRGDDIGRQLVRPVQVRDLVLTAYASFSTGTEATLLAAQSGFYTDLIYILASNNSTAAVGIDIRAVSGGNIVMHLEIPANGTTGVAAPVPINAQGLTDETGNAWTVDLPDVTGTVVYVSALFSKEV